MLKKWVEHNISVEKLNKDKVAITAFEVYSENKLHYGSDGSFLLMYSMGGQEKEILVNLNTLEFLGNEVSAIKWILVDMFSESSDTYKDVLSAFFPVYRGGLKYHRDTAQWVEPVEPVKEYIKIPVAPRVNTKKIAKQIAKIEKDLKLLRAEIK